MSERKFLTVNLLWAAAAVAAAVLAMPACNSQPDVVDRCTGVKCAEPLTCDPGDGICKCGGPGGTICDAQACSLGVCQHQCGDLKCTDGTSLDPVACLCRCGGQGGTVCQVGERCDPLARRCFQPDRCTDVVCGTGFSCDPADGQCKCGGEVCGPFQGCKAGVCVDDPCHGVSCTGATTCSPADGKCHCGGPDGLVCSYGETCDCPGGQSSCVEQERRCATREKCLKVQCQGGTTCDPADGMCRCGGPGGPVCQFGQNCDLRTMTCLSADRCKGVVCSDGLSCDQESGECRCGGFNGLVCAAGQACAATPERVRCVKPCDPLAQNCDTDANEGCYFDVYAKLAYCMPHQTMGDHREDTSCTFRPLTDTYSCNSGLHCQFGVNEDGIGRCRNYCKVRPDGATQCPQSVPQDCFQLEGAPPGVGACNKKS